MIGRRCSNSDCRHDGPDLGVLDWPSSAIGSSHSLAESSASCSAWSRPAASRWPSTAWPTASIDATNPRTAGRHLPAGILSVSQVTAFTVICAAGFVASTLLFLPNRLPLYLSIPVLAFLAGYSFTKRFTSLAHFWLGTALALSPVAAWIAIRGDSRARPPVRPAAGARARRRGSHLGRRLRHHLRLPRLRRRRRRRPPQYSRPPRHSEARCGSPPSATCSRSSH